MVSMFSSSSSIKICNMADNKKAAGHWQTQSPTAKELPEAMWQVINRESMKSSGASDGTSLKVV